MNDFLIAGDHADIVSELSDEQAGMVFKALFNENPAIDDVAARIVYKTIYAQVSRYKEKYNKKSEAGKKGMQKRWGDNKPITSDNKSITNDSKETQEDNSALQAITPVPVPVPDSKEITSKDVTKKFRRPTVEEVQTYVTEQGLNVDAQRFVDFYESKGWMVGKTPMKYWKAAVRNWGRSKQEKTAKVNGFTVMSQRDFDWENFGRAVDGC